MSEVTHVVPVSTPIVSLSRFKSKAIDDGVDVNDRSEGLLSKDLAALSLRILLDGLSVDMVIVKRECRDCALLGNLGAFLLPTVIQWISWTTVQTFIKPPWRRQGKLGQRTERTERRGGGQIQKQ